MNAIVETPAVETVTETAVVALETAMPRTLTLTAEQAETLATLAADKAAKVEGAKNKLMVQTMAMVATFRASGAGMTDVEWSKGFAPLLREALQAKKLAKQTVENYVSQFKTLILVSLCKPEGAAAYEGDRLMGETLADFHKRCKGLLPTLTLPDGRMVKTGELPARGRQPGEGETPAPEGEAPKGEGEGETPAPEGEAPQGSAGDSSKQEGGTNAPPEQTAAEAREVAATVLMRNPKYAAKLLAVLASKEAATALRRFLDATEV